jgi:hypothetical protein
MLGKFLGSLKAAFKRLPSQPSEPSALEVPSKPLNKGCVLPPELLRIILRHCDALTLASFETTCCWALACARKDGLWEAIFVRERTGVWLYWSRFKQCADWKRRYWRATKMESYAMALETIAMKVESEFPFVLLCEGEYDTSECSGHVRQPLTIEGCGWNKTFALPSLPVRSLDMVSISKTVPNIILTSKLEETLVVACKDVCLKNLAILFVGPPEEYQPALMCKPDSSVDVSGCEIYSKQHCALFAGKGSQVKIRNCYIHSDGGHGLFCHGAASVDVANSLLMYSSFSGIEIDGGNLSVHHCVIGGNQHNGIGCAGRIGQLGVSSSDFTEPSSEERENDRYNHTGAPSTIDSIVLSISDVCLIENACHGMDITTETRGLETFVQNHVGRNGLFAFCFSQGLECSSSSLQEQLRDKNLLVDNKEGDFGFLDRTDPGAIVREAASTKVCTVALYGAHYLRQEVYDCETCGFVRDVNLGICSSCAFFHRNSGHNVKNRERAEEFFCDCFFRGSADIGCKHGTCTPKK